MLTFSRTALYTSIYLLASATHRQLFSVVSERQLLQLLQPTVFDEHLNVVMNIYLDFQYEASGVHGNMHPKTSAHGRGIKLGTPFLSTKENGTGLGLAVCYRIAERLGAKINVQSSAEGTSFSICFKTS